MRVSLQVQNLTRRKILESAHTLFCLAGFTTATVRDIARAVGVAPGTLFNYFPNKEAIAATLVGKRSVVRLKNPEQYRSFEELAFAYASAALRQWTPCRNYLRPVMEGTLGEGQEEGCVGNAVRRQHLDGLQQLSFAFRNIRLNALELNLYWTLMFGVVAFWANDTSRKQEATLALLDESVNMFANWVESVSHSEDCQSARAAGEPQRS